MSDKVIELNRKGYSQDEDLQGLRGLIQKFANQLILMGHRELFGSFNFGKFRVKLSVEIFENYD